MAAVALWKIEHIGDVSASNERDRCNTGKPQTLLAYVMEGMPGLQSITCRCRCRMTGQPAVKNHVEF